MATIDCFPPAGTSLEAEDLDGTTVGAIEQPAQPGAEPALEDVGVFGVDDEEWGRAVAAVIVGAYFDLENARLGLERTLAPHKRPRRWMRAESLPRTASGKLKRVELEDRFARGELERL